MSFLSCHLLLCEYRHNPEGLEEVIPRLSREFEVKVIAAGTIEFV